MSVKPTPLWYDLNPNSDAIAPQLQLPPIKTISVSVYANGFYGQFKIPETYFKELTSYLSERVLP